MIKVALYPEINTRKIPLIGPVGGGGGGGGGGGLLARFYGVCFNI